MRKYTEAIVAGGARKVYLPVRTAGSADQRTRELTIAWGNPDPVEQRPRRVQKCHFDFDLYAVQELLFPGDPEIWVTASAFEVLRLPLADCGEGADTCFVSAPASTPAKEGR